MISDPEHSSSTSDQVKSRLLAGTEAGQATEGLDELEDWLDSVLD